MTASDVEKRLRQIEWFKTHATREIDMTLTLNAQWTTKFINDLPDSAFLYIESGGEKDEEGKTVPRSLRHFPYKNSAGKIDLPHLRNALARIPQSALSDSVKERISAKAERILAAEKKRRGLTVSKEYAVITTNLTGMVRNDMMEGRDFLVVPMVMMVEGVLNGSNGPLYYPAEELAKVPQVWNHKPIVVYHPTMNGVPLSACDPDIITGRKIGVIMNTSFDGKRLKAEAWLEPERVKQVDDRIMDALENNRMMEVSTGLFTENEQQDGEFNGKEYTAIARNYRPDHLAILPDQIGACSIADGAGLLRANAAGNRGELEQVLAFLGLHDNELSHSDISMTLSEMLREREGQDGVWVEEVFDNRVIYQKGGTLFQQDYTIGSDDQVVLVGNPVEVKKEVTFSVLSKENEMEKKEMIQKVIANTAWTEDDQEFLEGLEIEQLQKMLPAANAEGDGGSEEGNQNPPAEGEQNNGDDTPDGAEGDGGGQNPEQNQLSPEQFLEQAPPELREVLKESLQTHAQKKQGLIEKIIANERNIFTKEQLSSMSVSELSAIAALAAVEERQPAQANYYGMAPVAPVGNTQDVEPLVAPTLNFEPQN